MVRRISLVLFFICTLHLPAHAQEAQRNDTLLQEGIQRVLNENPDLLLDILKKNPEQVLEIVEQGVEVRKAAFHKQRLQKELQNPYKPALEPGRLIMGSLDAPIMIVEYSDFQCPYCIKGADRVKALMKKYPGKFCLLFKHHTPGDLSKKLALYFEAIGLQSPAKAWAFYDVAFKNRGLIKKEKQEAVDRLIAPLELDMQRLKKDLEKKELADRIAEDYKEVKKFGFTGRPTFLINGVSVRGAAPMEEFERIIKMVEARDAQEADDVPLDGEEEYCEECEEEEE